MFGICVANKPAKVTEAKLLDFLRRDRISVSPFGIVRLYIECGSLAERIRVARFGQYARIERAFRAVVEEGKLDLDHLTVEALEAIPGIGPKTARMIVLYSDPNANCVPLDTHVLKFLRFLGHDNVPKSTPPKGKRYLELEKIFQQEAEKRGVTVRKLDTDVWQSYARL